MTFNANPSPIQRMGSRRSLESSPLGAARAFTIAPDALSWLAHTRSPRWLHIFERACNLINERREILSVVGSDIGNGPFNIVLAEPYPSSLSNCDVRAPITIGKGQLILGSTPLDLRYAGVWFPKPDWQLQHENRVRMIGQILDLHDWLLQRAKPDSLLRAPFRALRDQGVLSGNPLQLWVSRLCSAVANADVEACQTLARRVAGFGPGLTPAGDDLILGAMYAAWVIHPSELAGGITSAMSEAACPRTTSLSAAWLRAGGSGEASTVWHDLLHALLAADAALLRGSVEKLLAVGHTSGADALAGFVGTLLPAKHKILETQ